MFYFSFSSLFVHCKVVTMILAMYQTLNTEHSTIHLKYMNVYGEANCQCLLRFYLLYQRRGCRTFFLYCFEQLLTDRSRMDIIQVGSFFVWFLMEIYVMEWIFVCCQLLMPLRLLLLLLLLCCPFSLSIVSIGFYCLYFKRRIQRFAISRHQQELDGK